MNSIIPLENGLTGVGVLTCELIYGLREPDKEAQADIGMSRDQFSKLDEDQQKFIKRRIANFWYATIHNVLSCFSIRTIRDTPTRLLREWPFS
jgi:hypothetical protein